MNFVSGEFRPHRYPFGCLPTGCLGDQNSQEMKVKLQEACGAAYQSKESYNQKKERVAVRVAVYFAAYQSKESYNQESLYSIKRVMIPTKRVVHSMERTLSMKIAPTFCEKSQHSMKRAPTFYENSPYIL